MRAATPRCPGPPGPEAEFNPAGTISVHLLQLMAFDAERRGHDFAHLTADLGVTPALMADVDGRVPAWVAVELWRRAAELARDPCYGLHLGELIAAHAGVSLGGHMMLASANVRESLLRILRVERMFHDVRTTSHTLGAAGLSIRVRTKDDPIPVPVHGMHCVFALMVLIEARATGAPLVPLKVAFEHPPPAGAEAECLRIFGRPAEFEAHENELVIAAEDLERPHLTVNLHLGAVLDRHAEAALAKLAPVDELLTRARREVLAHVVGQREPTLGSVARALGTSARTLQRRLGERGTTFQAVVDEARRELAERYVDDRSLPLVEVAFALGFSDQASFHRAFQRWTGSTPGAYRARHHA
jgi:AraC-like DNA-binding protein